MAPSDSDLVKRTLGGDPSAFQELVERYQSKVFTVVYGMWQDAAEAEEIAQDVFVLAFRSLSQFRADAAFATWLYRIAVNRCQDHRRKAIRRQEIAPQSLSPPPEEAVDGPEAEVLAADERRQLRQHLDSLPDIYRVPVYLHYFAHRSYKEIAQNLGISVKGVEARLARARELLRDSMEGGADHDGLRRKGGSGTRTSEAAVAGIG